MSYLTGIRDFLVTFLALSSVILETDPAVIGLDRALDSEDLELLEQSSMDVDLDLQERMPGPDILEGRTVAELGAQYSPSSLLKVANPLRDQPNLSTGRTSPGDQMIHGSRKAFAVTKVEYLKKEWCKTEPLKQIVREEGCLQRTVVNRFCYGQCNSFFIPKSNKKDLEAAAFKSCSFCKPKRYSWITVTLRCPRRKPRFKRKRIQIIKRCKCMAQTLD